MAPRGNTRLCRRSAADEALSPGRCARLGPAMLVVRDEARTLQRDAVVSERAMGAPSSSDGAGSSRVEALLQVRLIMPILDGFDELLCAVRGHAIAQINDQLRPGERFVMTSRTEEYRVATRPAAGPEITLAAAAVELRPLDVPDVISYLRQAAGGPISASRWDPVFAALARPGTLAQVLSNPLMVGLARTIYKAPDAGQARVPACGNDSGGRGSPVPGMLAHHAGRSGGQSLGLPVRILVFAAPMLGVRSHQ